MGWKSTLRSLEAASRRAARERERDARRRQRELAKLQKEMAKADAQRRAQLEVRQYENTVELLTSLQRDCGDVVDWRAVAASTAPEAPSRSDQHERTAQEALDAYQPGFFARLFGGDKKRRDELEIDIELGRQMDKEAFDRATAEHRRAVDEWRDEVAMAEGILRTEAAAFGKAAQELERYHELGEWGIQVSVTVGHADRMGVTLTVPSDDVIPTHRKTLTATGKLSERALPKGARGEMYQDFVCGAVLRAVRESLALFPIDYVVATAETRMLNTATGHLEDSPIVSIICPRATVDELNLADADASDALANFMCRMKFRKTKGFSPVDAYTLDDVPTE